MKTTAALVLLSALSASAFVPMHKPAQTTALRITPEEDLELTRKVIAKFFGDDAGSEPAPAPKAAEPEPEKKKKKSKKSN